ncbi:unnamed protein product [Rangifer tarandus platyrhynchus]|uniref:Uncharacterized protein n=1 Tax=Rangifer tarandus platyrhynchus TaxID=3082113 RepID=A0ABN9A446_RANTA|nr:unnamed protein product [Rangifer tarandus platyrhynchus]
MELQRSLGNVAYLCDQEEKEKKIVTDRIASQLNHRFRREGNHSFGDMTEVWPCPIINAPTSPGTEAQPDAFCPTSLRKVLLQLLQHHVRLRKLEYAWGPLLKTRPELRAAAASPRSYPSAAWRRSPSLPAPGPAAQYLAQSRGVVPVDASVRAVLDDDARPLHSPILAADRLLPLLGRCGQCRLGLPLPPSGRHGAWGLAGDRTQPRPPGTGQAGSERRTAVQAISSFYTDVNENTL